MPPYSQPAPEMQTSAGSEAPQGTASSFDVKLSLVASYAHSLGDPDGVRDLLAPGDREAFDRAYAVQADRAGVEKSTAVERRTEDFVRDATAKRNATERVAEQERAALYAAAEADAEAFGAVLNSAALDDIPDPEFLIDGFLYKNSVVRLYGPPKSYKSFVMLDMAGCVGSGINWLGKNTESGRVLYVVAEGVQGIKRRVRAWEAQNKRPMTGVDFYPRAIQLGKREEVRALIAFAKRRGYALIILDTQARCTVGIEENSNTDMGLVVAALDVLKEVTGACVALVHHSGADGARARGATAILGALDAEFRIEADKKTSSVKLETIAQKDTGEHPVIEMDLVTPGPGLALAVKPRPKWYQQTVDDLPALPASEMQALRAVGTFFNGAPLTMIATDMGVNKGTLYKTLDALNRKGCIMKQGATYKIEKLGRTYLEADDRE